MTELLAGTVTFLFTDIEGSTGLAQRLRERYAEVLDEHERLLRDAFEGHGGRIVDMQGDALFAAFPRAKAAVEAAVAAQLALRGHDWPGGELRVRMSLHTGEPVVRKHRYVGVDVHRAARLCAAARGGQILVSSATRELVDGDLPEGWALDDLGERRLRGLERSERVFQLAAPELPVSFPPLRGLADQAFAGRPGVLAEQTRGASDLLPAVRASDEDREQTVAALREHSAAGRLTLEEFAERAEIAYAAKTTAELAVLHEGLPEPPVPRRRRPKRLTLALFGRFIRRGRWRVPRRTFVLSAFSDVDFDVREADAESSVVTIFVLALFGNVDVYVPGGVEVDAGGLVLGGHRRDWGPEAPAGRGTPLVRVRVLTLLGTVDVWRVPSGIAGTYREIIQAVRAGQRELPAP